MTTRYAGPRSPDAGLTSLAKVALKAAPAQIHGLRDNFEVRDLGVTSATGGKMALKHSRAIKPFEVETGWHWHDMDVHVVHVLKGSITFRFEGEAEPVTVRAGETLNQPAGVPHNVVGYSTDLELLEINLPADHGTYDLPAR